MRRITILAVCSILVLSIIFTNIIDETKNSDDFVDIDMKRLNEVNKEDEISAKLSLEPEEQERVSNIMKQGSKNVKFQTLEIEGLKDLEDALINIVIDSESLTPADRRGIPKLDTRATMVIGDQPAEQFTINSDNSLEHIGDIIIMGTGLVTVNGILNLTGNLLITQQGRFLVDNGEFRIKGDDTHILLNKAGSMVFQNYSLFHYQMTYLHQHALVMYDDSSVDITQSHVSHSGSSGTIIMYDNSSYTVFNSTYADWKTWYLHNDNYLKLENVYIGGDIVFYGGATMEFINTLGIMPWLYFGSGAFLDYSFPIDDPLAPVSASINNSTPGVSGIPWSFKATNCYSIAWGINPYPGSNVTVRDSELRMILFRFVGDSQMDIEGILVNNMSYSDLTFPIEDRTLRLINTSVNWWKVDIHEGFSLNATSIRFSEMVVAHNSTGYLYNSTCEGQTVHLGAQDDAFVHFKSGEVWSYTSVWGNATMILEDSLVDYRKGEYTYQTRNLAHGNSKLYCLNTSFGYESDPSESRPEALDNALVMNLKMNNQGVVNPKDTLELSGSAWIKTGPGSSVTFDRYDIRVAPEGSTDWTVIYSSSVQVKGGSLGEWDTTGISGGTYKVQLQLWVNNGPAVNPTDEYPLEKSVKIKNLAPMLEPSPPKRQVSLKENEMKNFSLQVADEYPESLIYNWSLNGSPIKDQNKNYYVFKTNFNSSGEYTLSVVVTDNGLEPLKSSWEWKINVLNVNRPPVIVSQEPASDLQIYESEDGVINFSVNAYDPDDDTLSYTWFVNSEEILGEADENFRFNYDFNSTGTNEIIVIVDDFEDEITAVWNLIIIDVNRPPVILTHTPENIYWINETYKGSIDFNIGCFDPDGDILYYSWFMNSTEQENELGSGYQFNFNYSSAGYYEITVLVNDSSEQISFTWQIEILNVNRKPVISSFYPSTHLTINDATNITFSVTGYDFDLDDELTYEWFINDALIEGEENSTISYSPNESENGTYIIRVDIIDSFGEKTAKEWQVTIIPSEKDLDIEDDKRDDDGAGELEDTSSVNRNLLIALLIILVVILIILFILTKSGKGAISTEPGHLTSDEELEE
jgi:hypothetical protein